jgi:hypothetical protein
MKRSSWRRLCTVLAVAFLTIMALEAPASAAPPANDSITSATPLGAPPATFVVDTRQATASSTDGSCVQGRSVWFRTRPTVTRTVRLSTLGSDYDTLLAVFRGPRTNRTRIACADDTFDINPVEARQVRFVAGNTYWVAVSACCSRTAPGGQLVLNTFRPTATKVTPTIDSVETGLISGRLLVHGTTRCTTPSEFELDLSASQRVAAGANVASGDGFADGICGPDAGSPWTVRLDSQGGWAFQEGSVSVTTGGFGSDGFNGVEVAEQTGNFDVTVNPNAHAPATIR